MVPINEIILLRGCKYRLISYSVFISTKSVADTQSHSGSSPMMSDSVVMPYLTYSPFLTFMPRMVISCQPKPLPLLAKAMFLRMESLLSSG